MKKEFIQKVRDFLSGKPLMLTEVLDWLAESQPIKNKKSGLSKVLIKLQTVLFYPRLPFEILEKLHILPSETLEKLNILERNIDRILMSYYELDNAKDWKFAIKESVDDVTKLSYFNYKNAEKYKVQILYVQDSCTIKFKIGNEVFDKNTFPSDIRIKGKPTSVLKSLIDFLFYNDNKHWQEVMDYVSYFYDNTLTGTIKEISGKDILWAYHHENYVQPKNSGLLWKSCMQYDHCQEYLKIYSDNPDKINMIVVVNTNDKVLGRVLLWKPEESSVYYDRIYAYNSFIENKIKDYCLEKGYISLSSEDEYIKISLNYKQYDYLPHLDKLYYFTEDGIQNFDSDDVICLFRCSSGHHFLKSPKYIEIEGRYYHVDDLYYSRYLDEYLLEAHHARYNRESIDYFPVEDVAYSSLESVWVYIHSPDVVYLDYCDEYVFKSNCMVDYKGVLRDKSHVVFSKELNEYIMKEEAEYYDDLGWVVKGFETNKVHELSEN